MKTMSRNGLSSVLFPGRVSSSVQNAMELFFHSKASKTNANTENDTNNFNIESTNNGINTKPNSNASLWAMERITTQKSSLLSALKAWRIPACLDMSTESLSEDIGPLIYLDRLQVHQFYWRLGKPNFLCTKFKLCLYDRSWEQNLKASQVIATLEVYPHVINLNNDSDIINVAFVNPQKWGKRCPIVFLGEESCIGVKKGGVVKKDLIFLAFQCDYDLHIPDINVDISNLDIGDEIAIKDLNLGFELTSNLAPSAVICKVLSPE